MIVVCASVAFGCVCACVCLLGARLRVGVCLLVLHCQVVHLGLVEEASFYEVVLGVQRWLQDPKVPKRTVSRNRFLVWTENDSWAGYDVLCEEDVDACYNLAAAWNHAVSLMSCEDRQALEVALASGGESAASGQADDDNSSLCSTQGGSSAKREPLDGSATLPPPPPPPARAGSAAASSASASVAEAPARAAAAASSGAAAPTVGGQEYQTIFDEWGVDSMARHAFNLLRLRGQDGQAAANDVLMKLIKHSAPSGPGVANPSSFVFKSCQNAYHQLTQSW